MPTTPEQRRRRPAWRSRWWMPGLCLALGLFILAAFAIGGDTAAGLRSLAVMGTLGIALAVAGGRSETVSGLGGPGRDERWAFIDQRATAFAGGIVILAVIGAWLVEAARGHDADAYVRLVALGGIAYVAAIAWLRRR